jgi:WD40 repeat protein
MKFIRLFVGTVAGVCYVWDVVSERTLGSLKGHKQAVSECTWSKTGTLIVTASDDSMLLAWRVIDDLHVQQIYRGHRAAVLTCCLSATDSILASGSTDETIRLWDVTTGECLSVIPAHSDPITSVCFLKNDSLLLSASCDRNLRIWDTSSFKCLVTLEVPFQLLSLKHSSSSVAASVDYSHVSHSFFLRSLKEFEKLFVIARLTCGKMRNLKVLVQQKSKLSLLEFSWNEDTGSIEQRRLDEIFGDQVFSNHLPICFDQTASGKVAYVSNSSRELSMVQLNDTELCIERVELVNVK